MMEGKLGEVGRNEIFRDGKNIKVNRNSQGIQGWVKF